MNNHLINHSGPGTIWSPDIRNVLVGPHRVTIDNLFSAQHYHLYLKSAYAEAYIKKSKDFISLSSMYDKMQISRIGESKREKFNDLIESFKMFGFNKEFPIPVSKSYQVLDGSHRLAASFALGEIPYIEIYNNDSHLYNRSWFESVGFLKKELAIIDRFQSVVSNSFSKNDLLHVGIVWCSALDYWDDILLMLESQFLLTAFCWDFENNDSFFNFVLESYQGDGMDLGRIREKAFLLSEYGTKVGIFVLKNMPHQMIKDLKKSIRDQFSAKIDNYFFDNVVHILDCPLTSRYIFFKYSPKK